MSVLLIVCILLGFTYPSPVFSHPLTQQGMEFRVADWAYDVRDEGDYDLNETGSFPRGKRAYAYLELTGFSLGEESDFFYHKLGVDVALSTKGGFRLYSRKNVLELESWYKEHPDAVWFYIYVDVPKFAPRGKYITEITVRDELTDNVLYETREIEVY